MMSLSPSEHVEEADGGDGDAGGATVEYALGCNSIDIYCGYKFGTKQYRVTILEGYNLPLTRIYYVLSTCLGSG